MSVSVSGALAAGTFRLHLRPDGRLVVPDLVEGLIPALSELGADPALWCREPCAVPTPALGRSACTPIPVPRQRLSSLSEQQLWELHSGASRMTALEAPGTTTLMDVKCELANRLLRRCTLCLRHCCVDRARNVMGVCGLAAGLEVGAYGMLYNEGPLVGAPTFSVYTRGCALRCADCYRPEETVGSGTETHTPEALAAILDMGTRAGAESWQFLGGNPEESLPGILRALSLCSTSRPVVWNSSLIGSRATMRLLKGVVDVWVPDLKFGNDVCARLVAHVDRYCETVHANLRLLMDQPHVIVRHLVLPGHEDCCRRPVQDHMRTLPANFMFVELPVQDTGATLRQKRRT